MTSACSLRHTSGSSLLCLAAERSAFERSRHSRPNGYSGKAPHGSSWCVETPVRLSCGCGSGRSCARRFQASPPLGAHSTGGTGQQRHGTNDPTTANLLCSLNALIHWGAETWARTPRVGRKDRPGSHCDRSHVDPMPTSVRCRLSRSSLAARLRLRRQARSGRPPSAVSRGPLFG